VDATIHLKSMALGVRKKERDTDPQVLELVKEWRLARRAGDRMGARVLAAKVDEARLRAAKARS
jgi:hypothetical protein